MHSDDRPSSNFASDAAGRARSAQDAPTWRRPVRRRSLLKAGVGAGVGLAGAGLALSRIGGSTARAASSHPTKGDIAILRFLAAAEILETDLWQQYNELGGIQDSEEMSGSGNAAYTNLLVTTLDMDMPQYIHDNTDDEFSHFTFINAYLQSVGAEEVNLDHFRTLKGSVADGVDITKIGKRLTNLTQLTVDTSFWTRYRSATGNPDLGDSFAPAIPDLAHGQFPAIPRDNGDIIPNDHLQAIVNTAGFHFAFIEQGGSSLYPSLAQRVTNPEVLRILLSIGPTETAHFQTWHDKAGNFIPLTDPTNGLHFPNLNNGSDATQTNLIMPEPTAFLNKRRFPPVSIIRPTETEGAAMGAVKGLTDDGLFIGQVPEFFDVLQRLAEAADDARREG